MQCERTILLYTSVGHFPCSKSPHVHIGFCGVLGKLQVARKRTLQEATLTAWARAHTPQQQSSASRTYTLLLGVQDRNSSSMQKACNKTHSSSLLCMHLHPTVHAIQQPLEDACEPTGWYQYVCCPLSDRIPQLSWKLHIHPQTLYALLMNLHAYQIS